LALTTVGVVVVTPPHTFLTVSHDVPVRRPFAVLALPRRFPPIVLLNPQVHTHYLARTDLPSIVRANGRIFAVFIALAIATP
jgi:hypothetical protein